MFEVAYTVKVLDKLNMFELNGPILQTYFLLVLNED